MSTDNVEIVRRLVAAFNDRDLDALLQATDPGVELQSLRAQLEGRTYSGHEGVRQMLADFDEDWEFVRMEADSFREREDDVVLLGRLQARGRASGVDLDVPIGVVWSLRDGRIVRAKTFSEQADALGAAGVD